jgi:hypothetical protein
VAGSIAVRRLLASSGGSAWRDPSGFSTITPLSMSSLYLYFFLCKRQKYFVIVDFKQFDQIICIIHREKNVSQ